MNFWEIPGPRLFVESISDAVADGRIVIVHFPENGPDGLLEAIQAIIGFDDEIVEPGKDLILRLQAQVGEEEVKAARKIDAPFLSPRLAGRRFLIITCERETASGVELDLISFGEIARLATRGEFPSFLVLLHGRAADRTRATTSSVVAHIVWDARVSPIDMVLYATYALRKENSWRDPLLARVAAAVACYDPTVVDRLANVMDEAIFDPTFVLETLRDNRSWSNDNVSWVDGSISMYEGRDTTHSACASPAMVAHRIWCAQVAELFPPLELRRREAVERHERRLRIPEGEQFRFVKTIQDLELSHIIWQLTGRTDIKLGEIALFKQWRDIRNDLAHGDVIELSRLDDRLFMPLKDSALA
jgi:hypothetical protein